MLRVVCRRLTNFRRVATAVTAPEAVGPRVLAFARDFGARLDEHVDRTVDAIFAEIPRYHGALRPDAIAHTRENFLILRAALELGRPITADELGYTRAHAARRVRRGLPLKDFLHAFRIGHRVVWEIVMETLTSDPEGQEAALDIAGSLIQFFNVLSSNAAETYLEAQQLLLAEDDRHRRDLLEDLLAGAEPAPGPRLSVAREAGLGPDAPLVVALAAPTGKLDGELALRNAAMTIAQAVAGRVPPLVVVRQSEVVVIRALGPEEVADLARALDRVQAALAAEGLGFAIGVSTVHAGWRDVAGAYREAESARDDVGPAGGVLALAGLSALDYLTRRRDDTAARLVDPGVRAFVEQGAAAGGALIATLLAYAECDMNATAAAARLHVHANTARYRLARIAERSGRDLRRLSDVMELVVAIRLVVR
jgi:sugar diacid utilization regulator